MTCNAVMQNAKYTLQRYIDCLMHDICYMILWYVIHDIVYDIYIYIWRIFFGVWSLIYDVWCMISGSWVWICDIIRYTRYNMDYYPHIYSIYIIYNNLYTNICSLSIYDRSCAIFANTLLTRTELVMGHKNSTRNSSGWWWIHLTGLEMTFFLSPASLAKACC